MREGWQVKTIGDLCDFHRGLTYTKSDEVDASDNIVLRASNIDLTTNLLTFDDLKHIRNSVAIPEGKKVKKDSLLICTASGSKSHLGKVAYIDNEYDYAFGGFMGMLTPSKDLMPKFLFHLMTSEEYKSFIMELSDGANINNLKFDDLKRFSVPVPPLPEQQRIVRILDEAFESIAKAKANAEKNLQNAREVFESYLNEVFTRKGEGWEKKSVGDVSEIVNGGTPRTGVPEFWDGPYQWLTPAEMGGRPSPFVERTARTLTEDGLRNSSARLLSPYSVILSSRAPIGHLAINTEPMATNQGCKGLVPKQAVNYKFLYYFLLSSVDLLNDLGTGATFKELSGSKLRDVLIPLPPLPEQQRIVEELDSLSDGSKSLFALYQQKLYSLDELKQSLLHQAFNGDL